MTLRLAGVGCLRSGPSGGLWLRGHEPPLLRVVQPGGPFGMAGGARGWVAGWAGLWGVPPTWVWVVGFSPQILEHPTSISATGVNLLSTFSLPKTVFFL